MALPPLPPLPSLIVVTGRPGAGKTTLAHRMAEKIRCPLISRDEIKEGFVNTTGQGGEPGDEIARGIYVVFFDTIKLLLSHRITMVAEAAFQHKVWAPKLEPLREIAHLRIVLCEIDPQLARSRHIERSVADPDREGFHPDATVKANRQGRQTPIDIYDPPHLDVPTLAVDTASGYQPDFQTIVSFARG